MEAKNRHSVQTWGICSEIRSVHQVWYCRSDQVGAIRLHTRCNGGTNVCKGSWTVYIWRHAYKTWAHSRGAASTLLFSLCCLVSLTSRWTSLYLNPQVTIVRWRWRSAPVLRDTEDHPVRSISSNNRRTRYSFTCFLCRFLFADEDLMLQIRCFIFRLEKNCR